MPKIKTSELTDAALDWAAWTAAGGAAAYPKTARGSAFLKLWKGNSAKYVHPSTDWAQGGPIIDREMLCVGYQHQADPNYCPMNDPATICWARTTAGGYLSYGPTPLIAAMRCYVASKLGAELDVPDELT